MKLQRVVCMALGMSAAAAAVASADLLRGVYVGREQERLVTTGMKCDEVRALLGNPAASVEYRADAPTWTYYLVGHPPGNFLFDVQFNADCRVVSKGERVLPALG